MRTAGHDIGLSKLVDFVALVFAADGLDSLGAGDMKAVRWRRTGL